MCLGGGGGGSTSTSEGRATANVSFNPIISVGANTGDPAGRDTGSTFAKTLLAAPPLKVSLPDQPKLEDGSDDTTKLLLFVAVALAARKVLHG